MLNSCSVFKDHSPSLLVSAIQDVTISFLLCQQLFSKFCQSLVFSSQLSGCCGTPFCGVLCDIKSSVSHCQLVFVIFLKIFLMIGCPITFIHAPFCAFMHPCAYHSCMFLRNAAPAHKQRIILLLSLFRFSLRQPVSERLIHAYFRLLQSWTPHCP